MRHTITIAGLFILMLFVLADCKKSSNNVHTNNTNNSVDTNMAGMRTWEQMQVAGSVDSTGMRHYDTTYTNIRTQIIPISGTTVLLYSDSASTYADTLLSFPSNAPGVMSFVKGTRSVTVNMSDTIVTTTYDSVAFNYTGVYSMLWYHLNTLLENTIEDSTYTISHTP